jgi:membrane protein required for colicin V production
LDGGSVAPEEAAVSLSTLDIILVIVLLITLVLGLIKGLVRQAIGLVAVVAGLVLAAQSYPRSGAFVRKIVSNGVVADFIGFLALFAAVIAAGWLVGLLISKLMKGPLNFLDHVLGGVFGLFKGVLICGVIVFALLVFEVRRDALAGSKLGPLCFQATRAVVRLIPGDLKAKFKAAYQGALKGGTSHGQEI